MIHARTSKSAIVIVAQSRGRRLAQRIGLSAAAAMLAGTSLVPAAAQTYDITVNNPGGLVVVSEFAGAPLFNPPAISNGTLRVINNGDVTFGGNLDDSLGALSLDKRGTGKLTLSGNNGFAGPMGLRVSAGTLEAGSTSALSPNTYLLITPGVGATATVDLAGFNNAITYLQGSGAAVVTNTVGTATLTIDTSETRLFDGALQGNIAILKRGTGTQAFANSNSGLVPTNATGAITLENGGIAVGSNNALGSGVLTVTGASTLSSANNVGAVFIGNDIVLNANLVVAPSPTTALRLNGDISGPGTLIKLDTASTLRLAGNNTQVGGTSILGGRVEVGSNTALGAGAVNFDGGVLALLDPAVGVTLGNDFTAGLSALTAEAGNLGTIFGFSGNIEGTRAVVLGASGGAGTVALSGANSYTGATRIQAGVLGIGSAGAVAATSLIRFENSGTGISILVPGLTIDRAVTGALVAGTTSATINTGALNVVFSGRLHDGNTGAGQFLGLTKAGAGTLTVSNAGDAFITKNILSGGLAVNDGTLNLTGRLEGDVTVNGGAFAGTGVVATGTTTINAGGTLSPGDATLGADAIGRLTLNNLTLAGGSVLRFDLGAPSIDTIAPPNDFVVVNGNLNLGGVLNVNPLGGFGVGTYRLFTYAGTLTGALGLGTLPGGFNYNIFAGSGFVDLNVLVADYYWDGVGPFGTGSVNGGNGDWTPAGTNWTDATGVSVVPWGNELDVSRAFFQGTAGTVRLTESRIFEELHFLTDGYVINPEDSGEVLTGLSTTINVADNVTATVNVAIDGGDGLTKIGGGTLNFGNANTYSGGTFLNAGRININNNDGLGFDGLVMAAGTTLGSYAGQVTLLNNITIAGGVTFDSDNLLRLDGVIDGSGGFTKTGIGELAIGGLGGPNSFTGNVNINAGALSLLKSDALGNAANPVNVAAGTLGVTLANGLNVANNFTLAGSTDFRVGAGATAELSGNIGGAAGSINKVDTGTLILSGTNGFAGGTDINAGTLAIDDAAAIGSGAIALADGATLRAGIVDGQSITLTNALSVVSGTGTVDNGPATVFANDGQVGVIGTTLAVSGAVTGAGTLRLSGGATRLADTSGFTGNIALSGGALLDLVDASSFGNGVLLSSASSGIRNNSGAALSFANTVTATGGFFVVGGANDVALTGAVAAQDLAKVGPATLTLANAGNAFASVQLYGGTIAVAANGALGNALVLTGAGTLQAAADNLSFANEFNGALGGDLTVDTQAFTMTLSGNKTSPGGLIKIGTGTLILGGTNSFAGVTGINQGTIDLQGTIANDVNVTADGRLMGNGSVGGTVAIANGGVLNPGNSPGTLNFGNLALNDSTNLVWDLDVINSVGLTNDLVIVAGNLTLDGLLQVQAGANFNIGVGSYTLFQYGNLLADGGVALTNGALPLPAGFDLLSPPAGVTYGVTTTSAVNTGAGSVLFNVAYNGTYFFDGNGTPVDGNIRGGPGTWNGALTNFTNSDGLFNLAYANSFTQVVQFGGTAAGGAVDVQGTRQFGTINFTDTGYVLGGAGDLAIDAAANLNVTAGTARINTVIAGNSTLNKGGNGELVLGSANTYVGDTNVNAGALALAANGATGTGTVNLADGTTLRSLSAPDGVDITHTNAVNIAGSATFDVDSAVFTQIAQISGGELVKAGSGRLVLDNGANNYSGGTNITDGTVAAGSDGALGTGNIRFSATGGTLETLGSFTTTKTVVVDAAGTINTNGNNNQFDGLVSGTGSLTKTGNGTATFAGVGSTFGGTFAVNNGTVLVNGSFANAAANYVVAGGATLGGSGSIAGSVVMDNGAFLAPGNAVGTLTVGNLTLSSMTNLSFNLNQANVLGGPLNDRVVVTGNLVLDGLLNVSETVVNSFGLGIYNLFSYGTLTDNGLTIDGILPGALTGSVQNNAAARQINLIVAGPDSIALNWDGADFTGQVPGAPLGQGGNGVWNATNTNWTGNAPGEINATWQPNAVGIFGGTGGTVDVASPFAFAGLAFQAGGYTLANAGGSLTTNAMTGSFISVDPALSTTINASIAGTGQLLKQGAGTLVLGGNNINFSGGTIVQNGTLQLAAALGAGTGTITLNGNTTLANGGGTLSVANAVITQGAGTINTGAGTFTLAGEVSGIGSLIKTGSGNLILSGSNLFEGGTSLTAGSLTVTNNNSIGTGALTTAANTTVFAGLTAGGGSVITLNNAVVVNGATTLNLQGTTAGVSPEGVLSLDGTTLTLTNSVSGSGPLLVTGFGRLNLNGNNSNFSGGTALTIAAVYVGSDSAFGTGSITLDNGIIGNDSGAQRSVSNDIVLAGGAVILGPDDLALSGVISGTGELAKRSSSTLTLSGDNVYEDGTLLSGGTIEVRSSTALGANISSLAVEAIGQTTTLRAGAADLNVGNGVFLQSGANLIVDTQDRTFGLAGAINGAGAITKTGTGNLVLNGANAYSGGSFINAGTVTVGSNTALGGSIVLMLDGTTLTTNAGGLALANEFNIGNVTVATEGFTFTLGGPVGGSGRLTKTGSGNLVLSGSNAYGGGTNLTAGSLTVTNNNSIGTGALTTTGGTALIVGTATGASTAVALGNAVALGAGTTSVNLQGTSLVFNNDGSIVTDGAALTLNAVVSGAGALATGNFGTLTLNGDNSYSGGTLINTRSVVYVGSDTAVGTGTVTTSGATALYNVSGATRTLANGFVLNGGTWLGGSNDLVLTGAISGAGFVIKAGAQTLTLNGANSFAGTSQLRDGRITVGTGTALGTGALRVFAPTVAPAPVAGVATRLTAGMDGLTLANAITLDTGSNLIIEGGAGSFTLAGVISGDGALTKTQAGTLVLNGANTFAGGSFINAGTVTLGTNTALGAGLVTMANGTVLANNTNNLVLANAFSIGNATIATGSNSFTLNGVIGGAGLLTKTGSGVLVLNGENSYSGGTALTAGTIRVGANLALGTGNVAAAAGTILQAGAAVTLANNFALAGGFTVDNFGQQLGLGGVISGTGPLSVIDSTAGTAGVLTLSGANSYTGGTVVTGTALRVSADVNLGNAAGNVTLNNGTLWTTASFATARTIALDTGGGTIQVAPGTAFTVNGTIAGTALTKTGAGELVLNALNNHVGGTSLNAGTITVANDRALGVGTLAMADGTTLNTATNLGTTPNSPTVTLANAVTTAGVATVNANTGLNLVLNGVVSGAGSIAKTGAGLLVLNGANSFGGGTALVGGTIRTGTGTALGTGVLTTTGGTTLQSGAAGLTLANAITLGTGTTTVDTQAFTFTLSGVASGAGGMSKIGSGLLNLTGASTYTGATTVAAGTLNVTGSLVSAVTVNSGAAITGTGTVGALNVLAGGSVNPGAPATTNSATLTVTGAATLAGTYTANVTASATDRITAGGALTLGGTLAVLPGTSPIFSQFNASFTVASGATRTGTFATVTGLDQFGIAFNPVVDYTATQANIRLAPQSLVTLGNRFGGISGNALEVATAFDRAVAAGYNPQAFFNVYANGGTALPQTLRQMSGEQRATERRVVLDSSRVVRESALDRLNGGLASLGGQQVSNNDGDRTITFWLRGAGSWGKSRTSGAATAFTAEQRGLITGIDWAKGDLTVGGAFHYTSTEVEYQLLGGSSNVETVGGAVYAGYRQDGGLVVNGGFSVSGARTNGSRAINLPSFAQMLAGTTIGTTYQAFGELGFDLAASADTRIEPFARFTYVKADMGALTETGGVAALAATKQTYDIMITNLGARFGGNVADGKVALSAAASWQYTGGDRSASTVIGIPAVGQNSLIRSVEIDRDALSLQADVGVNISDTIRFSLGYSGLIGKNNDDHGGRATLNFAF